jgi:hypothetical protein
MNHNKYINHSPETPMSLDKFAPRGQQVTAKPTLGGDWTEIEVRSLDTSGDHLASTTRMRSKEGVAVLDVSIEEYTGMSRRAKFTSVRLGEAAARELYALLSAKFGTAP